MCLFVCFNVFYRHSVISFIIYGQFWGHQLAALWLGVNFISMVLKHKQTKIINPLVAEHRHHSVEYKFYCNRSRQVPRTLHNIIIGNKRHCVVPSMGDTSTPAAKGVRCSWASHFSGTTLRTHTQVTFASRRGVPGNPS